MNTNAIPLVRASSARPLFRFLEAGGSSLRPVRDRLQPAFRGGEALLPVAYVGSLFDEATRATGLDDVGFRIGRETPIATFGDWGGLIARSASAGAFLEIALANYRHFNTGYRLWSVVRGEDLWLHLRYGQSLRRGRSQVIDLTLMMWLAALRAMLGPSWRPREIHLEGDRPRHASDIEALATQRVLYRQPSLVLVLPREDLARLAPPLSPAPRPALEPPNPALDFAGSVRQTIAALLRLGIVDLKVTAETAGMSERSFQRHLAEVGLRFSRLVEDARFDTARSLLANGSLRIIDVSTELGYQDSANFTRAFRRWSGISPQRFRRTAPGHASEPLVASFRG